ncbi:uncharacterized protein LOC110821263 [Carica papaya]|uniref:uncharacterized protein LOC110821263 n=1 Tax=Carica papaya TaxID=3649 RepID=UPI000B8D0D68|nr:uncharacterized protein LOC110821263 [Carica papaya]
MNRFSDNSKHDADEEFHHQRRRTSPSNFRVPIGGGHRPFDSPPRRHSGGGGGGFRPMSVGGGAGGGGGFPPMNAGGGGGTGGFGSNFQAPPPPQPLSGQKRGFPFPGRGGSPDRSDGGSFAKLFIGSVPKTAREEDVSEFSNG